jgi:hypothetical protein
MSDASLSPYSPEFGRGWAREKEVPKQPGDNMGAIKCNGSYHRQFNGVDHDRWPCDCDKQKEEAMSDALTDTRSNNSPLRPSVRIKVSIPVSVGGYTGQRDAWEELERDYQVSTDGDKIVLTGSDSTKRTIKFDPRDLDAALRAINAHKPVMRGVQAIDRTMP